MISKKTWIGAALVLFFGGCLSTVGPVHAAQDTASGSAGMSAEKQVDSMSAKADDKTIKAGDMVKVDYTMSLEDGTIVYSTRSDVAKDPVRKKMTGYVEPKTFGAEEVIAGKPARLPGVGQSVVGMIKGERKEVKLSPESAFGPSDPGKIQTHPTVRNMPFVVRMAPAEFVGRFRVFPIQEKEVQFAPFMKARVKEISENFAVLEMIVRDGQKHEETYGSVDVRRNGDEVVATLTPVIGASLKTAGGEGRITGADGKNFTVDFNSPLAGKTIVLNLEVTAVTPASELADIQIPWVENHDKGLLAAKEAGKPAVMLLYADWCSWCKKLQNETFPDPRIKLLKDRLVFIKVNSDKDKELQKKYGQNGFPLTILFDRKGQEAGRIDGYKDAAALRETLDRLIESESAQAS